jgi:ribosomal protein S18 acetylase RimI-like enzyme
LKDHPESFGAAFEEEQGVPLSVTAERLAKATEDNFTLGAVEGDDLVGMVGFFQQGRIKTRHRGMIWGMYVAPETRGQGIGRALLEEATLRARLLDGVEEIMLGVTVGNEYARLIYAGAGFESAWIESRALKVENRYYDLEWMILRF